MTLRPLRVLIVEDVERDAELLLGELKRGGFEVSSERVDTREAMVAALDRQTWDLVLSDYTLPHFSAPAALALVKERALDLPFIIVSATVGEETAVEAMRSGARDFMAKGRLARLIPAIERELRDAALRLEGGKLQEQLLISDRMASVGTLAAGVAHEINNPLAALMVNLDFATQDLAKFSLDVAAAGPGLIALDVCARLKELEAPLCDAREAADRVRLIVRDLKIFSRSDDETTGPVDIRRVLESSLRMAWNEIRHRARLVKDFTAVADVEGNEARLGQVFLNLVVNAAQAIPDGHFNENEIHVSTRPAADGRVVVEIRDTGEGIPESDLARIYEPFFTTKPVGVGTGLGLAICHRIVTSLGGVIQVESQLGKGTLVRVTLPSARGGVAEKPPAVSPPPVGRRGRILVVDDDPTIRLGVRRILAFEHEVVAVAGACEALSRISGGEQFDVILSDVMMPEMTGIDLHARLGELKPEQAHRMVFMTGGAFTMRARQFLEQVRLPVIEKPFDPSGRRALMRQVVALRGE